MTTIPVTVAAIGFLLGFRHAFEPDHLAAVTTLAMRRGPLREAAGLGLAWGAGHTASVGVVAVALIVAGWRLPPAMQPVGDLVVAVLLIGLGLNTLARHVRAHRGAPGTAHDRAHARHRAHTHADPRGVRESFGFGLAHGLAGSGAVVVLMVAAAATSGAQLGYLAAFGLGTTIGMLVVSLAIALTARAAGTWAGRLHLATAAAGIVIGLRLGVECLSVLAG